LSRSLTALAAACAATLALAPTALANGNGGNVTPRDRDARKFVENVSVPNILEHSIALEAIGKLNDDTREVFGSGYQESLDYVVSTLRASGYNPKITPFNFPFWEETQAPVLNMVAPTPKPYRAGNADSDPATVDFITMANSPTKELTAAPVFPVGGIVDPPTPEPSSASGCADADYAGVSGKVALVQRGTCPFVEKWERAQAAGATAVIIYNEGNNVGRQNPQFVDNQPSPAATIPAVIASYTLGNDFLQAYKRNQNPTVTLKVYGKFTDRFLNQVIAETKGGDPDHVVVVGAHLDSVPEGPGINDDGSGTALLLAQAQELASGKYNLRQKIRFGWWGAEEEGLVGSTYYAHNLTQKQVDKIDVMLDYDMLASANYARLVYDGDGSETTDGEQNPAGPEGSGKVEQVFDDWFRSNGQQSERIPFDGRSDYVGFTDRGIPAGGVFAGAEAPKTLQQEAMYGGTAGAWLDPCYHQLCDNLSTVMSGIPALDAEGLAMFATTAEKKAAARKMRGGALRSLRELGSAATYAVWYFAQSRDPFGTKPRGNKNSNKGHRGQRWQGHNKRRNG
jgi:Zn-dependent M28 family amino/carboxypeptidase